MATVEEMVGQFLLDERQRIDLNTHALFTISIATLTLMVDNGIIRSEQAAQRIEQIHAVLSAGRATDQRNPLLLAAIQTFREHDRSPAPSWSPTIVGGRDLDPQDS